MSRSRSGAAVEASTKLAQPRAPAALKASCSRTAAAPRTRFMAPEIVEVEPVVRLGTTMALKQRGVTGDSCSHGRLPASGVEPAEVREFLELDVVAVRAAIQADHENHGTSHHRSGPHGPEGESGRRTQKIQLQSRFIGKRAIAQHPD